MSNDVIRRVHAHWLASGAVLNSGATERQMRELERRLGAKVPAVLTELLHVANGFDPRAKDLDGFRFLPSGECSRAGPDGRVQLPSAIIFVEYLDWSWWYGVDVAPSAVGAVYILGTADGVPQQVSRTAEEFLELYLSGDTRLYPAAD